MSGGLRQLGRLRTRMTGLLPSEGSGDLRPVRTPRHGELVGDLVHEPQAMPRPYWPGPLARADVADLAIQDAVRRADQQPARSCAVPDRVRRQLVYREHHIHRPVIRHARNGRARRDLLPQQVQRGRVEALVDYDRPCFKAAAPADHRTRLPADGTAIHACRGNLKIAAGRHSARRLAGHMSGAIVPHGTRE